MLSRVKQVRNVLKDEGLDALIISSSLNITYLTGFSGFDMYERGGYAFLTKNNLYLFANSLYYEEVKNRAKNIEIIELNKNQKLITSLQKIIYQEKIKVIGFEENLTVFEYEVFKKLKWVKIKLANKAIEKVRVVKDASELRSLKKACKLTDKAYSNILQNIRINMTEKELAWMLEKYIKEEGGEVAFPSIIAFGKNSAIPHHNTDNTKLKPNSIVLLDFGAKVQGYCSDMTRTIFFGKAPEKFRKVYEAVFQSQQLPYQLRFNFNHAQIRLNLNPEKIDKLARDYIVKKGYPTIPHSVGHGVGMEVHELPHIAPGFKEKLEKNTPFTIEPGIYIPGFGGVRIEDTVFFDGKKIIALTNSPKELIEI